MRYTGPTPATKQLVYARANERCELCGFHPITDIHHRRPRGLGGSRGEEINSPSNLFALCRNDHSFIEANRTFALENGWLISRLSPVLPREVPILRLGSLVYLLDDGSVVSV